ncbi:hypothetical protein [Oricola sp.]|uniref:hypothetical protein n=1 Tax=Oricola sp. TaxID=1979950 RepID=UPI0025DD48F1|nr:hypothetical protein [Oricola sp.]MCI5078564.1 hypothetical protein [Oricola sp.]
MARTNGVNAAPAFARMALAGALLCLSAPAGGALALECAAEDGIYKMGFADDAMLLMNPLAEPTAHSDLGIEISIEGHDGPFNFSLTASNGYSNVYAIPDADTALEDGLMVFFFEEKSGRLMAYPDDIPSAGKPAPDAIFLPELGSALWYGTNGTDNPVMITTGVWYLDDCR